MEASSFSEAVGGEPAASAADRGEASGGGVQLLIGVGILGSAFLLYAAIGFGIYALVLALS